MSDEIKKDIEDGTLLDDSIQGFQMNNVQGTGQVEIISEKDENGDYPVLQFLFKDGDNETKFALKRDEMAAITFALARQDQQHKLLDQRFLHYKERKVRLAILATKDVKAGDYIICWRKERVPQDYDYTAQVGEKQKILV